MRRGSRFAYLPAVTYAVKLVLKGGAKLSLVAGLRDPDQALFIEQQIRRH